MSFTAQLEPTYRVPWALTLLRYGEELGLKAFPTWSARMRAWQPELAEMLDTIVADEVHHVAMDHAIVRRWQAERPELARIHAHLYGEARRIYPESIHRSGARTWRRIAALLDGRRLGPGAVLVPTQPSEGLG